MAVVFAHVRQTWGDTAVVLPQWYPLRALGGSGYSGSYSNYSGSCLRPQRSRRRPQRAVLCPGSVGAMLTSAEGRAHAHWPARRNAAVYGDSRRTSAGQGCWHLLAAPAVAGGSPGQGSGWAARDVGTCRTMLRRQLVWHRSASAPPRRTQAAVRVETQQHLARGQNYVKCQQYKRNVNDPARALLIATRHLAGRTMLFRLSLALSRTLSM